MAAFAENYVDLLMQAWNGTLEFAQLIDCGNQLEAKKMGPLSRSALR